MRAAAVNDDNLANDNGNLVLPLLLFVGKIREKSKLDKLFRLGVGNACDGVATSAECLRRASGDRVVVGEAMGSVLDVRSIIIADNNAVGSRAEGKASAAFGCVKRRATN